MNDPIEGEIRKVLISQRLMENMMSRTPDGELVTFDWVLQEDDPEYGDYWEPRLTVHHDDRLYHPDNIKAKIIQAIKTLDIRD